MFVIYTNKVICYLDQVNWPSDFLPDKALVVGAEGETVRGDQLAGECHWG